MSIAFHAAKTLAPLIIVLFLNALSAEQRLLGAVSAGSWALIMNALSVVLRVYEQGYNDNQGNA